MNIFEIAEIKGPAVLGPLESTGGTQVYYAAFNGCPVLKHGKFGPESSFKDEDSAMKFAIKFATEVHGWTPE